MGYASWDGVGTTRVVGTEKNWEDGAGIGVIPTT